MVVSLSNPETRICQILATEAWVKKLASLYFPGSPVLTIAYLENKFVIFGSLAVITISGFRPMALRPRLSPGLPFRSVSV
jgi:hypothetical protein